MSVIISAFLAGLALDLLWVRCVSAVQRHSKIAAANYSVVLYACTVFSTVLIVNQCVAACVAFAAGSWVGAYLGVKK